MNLSFPTVLAAITISFAATPLRGAAQDPSQTFELRPSGISRVAFESDAPLETIEGVSTQTTGSFNVDLAHPNRLLSGRVVIPVNSLATGNAMRDGHLHGENWLDSAHHPNIEIELLRTNIRALPAGRTVRGEVTVRLTMHGRSKELRVPIQARYIPLDPAEHAGMDQVGINANMIRIKGQTKINLSDFGVSIMSILRLKVSNEITVRLDLTAFATPARTN